MKHRLRDLGFIAFCLLGVVLINTAEAIAALLGKDFDGICRNN